MRNFLGNYAGAAQALADANPYPYSYLASPWAEMGAWRAEAKGRVYSLLGYTPQHCPLNARILESFTHDGLTVERIAYDQPFGPSTEGFFLKPAGSTGPLPAVVALHDHGGFKYYGKEKIVALPDEPPILQAFKQECYGGESWASRLAKRGYAVFAPDVFLWGSRKMAVEEVPDAFRDVMRDVQPGTREYIEAYNAFAGGYETIVAKSLFLAGVTWPGIMAYDDRRAVDYLLTRPDVDAARIGCGGLSGGGQRTIYLAGLDDRIQCGVCAGFMSTFAQTVKTDVHSHTWMFHLPHLAKLMDLPDLAALSGGRPFMALYDTEDPLWALEGQKAADEKLKNIYGKMNRPECYIGKYYPGPHKFDVLMQNDAFSWFDKWLL